MNRATIILAWGDNRMGSLDHIKRNRNFNTKLLVNIPLEQRIGLAAMSQATKVSQQELIRRAIGAMLADFAAPSKEQLAPSRQPKTSAKAQKQFVAVISAAQESSNVEKPRPTNQVLVPSRGGRILTGPGLGDT
jgi:hypothetical protein